MTSFRFILLVQLFLDLAVPVLHIVVACTRFNDDNSSFSVMLTILLLVISWCLTNGISWVLLLRRRRDVDVFAASEDTGLNWTGVACHLLQLGPLWRFAKALSGSASRQYSNLILLHLIPVFLQDLPLSVLDVYLMLTARKEFLILGMGASASIISSSLILSAYREEVIRLTRKRKSSSRETTETSQDVSKMPDFPALGILRQETEKPVSSDSGNKEHQTLSGTSAHIHDNQDVNPSQNTPTSSQIKLNLEKANSSPSRENKNLARHLTRFVWMAGLLVSRVVSIASFTAVKPTLLFVLVAVQWLISVVGLRIQANIHNPGHRDCKGRLRDVATSYAYIFCFLNLKAGHAVAMSAFYHTIILTENVGLVAVFLWNFEGERVYMEVVTAVAFSSFFVAIFLIVVFYCLFSERAYLLIIENCACCIWWNSERKRRAEAKVARKAARLEAKKVMTQSGTQINAMATHIITTLSLLPKGQVEQDSTPDSQNVPDVVRDKSRQERDHAPEGVSFHSKTLSTLNQDESTTKGVSFTVDAFSENPSHTSHHYPESPAQDEPDHLPNEPNLNSRTEGTRPPGKPKTSEPPEPTGAPLPFFLLTPPTDSSRNKDGLSNQGLVEEVTAEVHEQRPQGQAVTYLTPTWPSRGTDDCRSFRRVRRGGLRNSSASLTEFQTQETPETFDEILLDEKLDICGSWEQSCQE